MMLSVMGSERRRRVAGVAVTLLVGAGMLVGQPVAEGRAGVVPAQEVQRAAKRPNIILISTDDMTASDLRWMPRTRKLLGHAGVTFPNALSPHPLCCPARAAILTGQYAQNNGVKSNQGRLAFPALKTHRTLPVWLDRAGYRTAFTGKYLNGFGSRGRSQPGWDWFDPTIVGQYNYEQYRMYRNGQPRSYNGLNNVDYVNHEVVRLVQEWAPRPQPFFIWASHVAPHGRLDPGNGIRSTAEPLPPTRFRHKFRRTTPPSMRSPAFNERDISDKTMWLQLKRPRPLAVGHVKRVFRARLRSLQGVDHGVARIIKALRRTDEIDHTYVVFTSDNGFLLGEHRLLTKNLPYWQSIRVPLLMRGPRIPHGAQRNGLATMIDLAPTIAGLARARPNSKVDGASLMPTIRRKKGLRSTVLIQAGPQQPEDRPHGWWWRGVTTGRYTYAFYYAEGFEELYDHVRDPAKTSNLADDPLYAGTLGALRERAQELGSCAGPASCSRRYPGVPDPLPGRGRPD
jgi:arylsulfatase A-like enzyme